MVPEKNRKKKPPGIRDKSISNHCPGEKEKNYRSKRKKRPTSSDPLKKKKKKKKKKKLKKKIKGYAVSWSKEN